MVLVLGSHSAVIFDMDGLLVDSEPLYMQAWQTAASELGRDLTVSMYGSLLGRPESDCEDAILELFGSDFPLASFRSLWKQIWVELVESGALQPKEGALELLDALQDTGTPLALATSSSRRYATITLAETKLADFFEHVVVAEDVVQGKPAPDAFLLASSRLQVSPSRCIVLEDSAAGAEAGLAAGMHVVLVPDILEPSEECSARVHLVARSLREASGHVLRAVRAEQRGVAAEPPG